MAKPGCWCSSDKAEARRMRTLPRRHKRHPINIPVWAENNRRGRSLFMKTWLLKLQNTETDMQWTKAGISYFKYFQTFSGSPRWQHLFLFWELFRGNFVAKITFMKVQQKRLERKQMKKHCGVNFPNWISPIFTQFCCAGTILLASKGALLSFCFYTMWMWQSDVQADDSARKFFLCEQKLDKQNFTRFPGFHLVSQ